MFLEIKKLNWLCAILPGVATKILPMKINAPPAPHDKAAVRVLRKIGYIADWDTLVKIKSRSCNSALLDFDVPPEKSENRIDLKI